MRENGRLKKWHNPLLTLSIGKDPGVRSAVGPLSPADSPSTSSPLQGVQLPCRGEDLEEIAGFSTQTRESA